MKRHGAVITFAKGVNKDQARAAMRELVAKGLIDPPGKLEDVLEYGWKGREKHFPHDGVHTFESDHGSPVFYIP